MSFWRKCTGGTTLCMRLKPEVVACGVIYAAARRSGVPLPEHPPWWTLFDADEAGIQEVCRVLAHLYSLLTPEATVNTNLIEKFSDSQVFQNSAVLVRTLDSS